MTGQARTRRPPSPVHWDRPLLLAACLMAPFAAVACIGLAIDDRELLGTPIWLKPLKFALSIAVYAGTWAWLVPMLPPSPRVRRAAAAIAVVLVLEMALMTGQVVRGRQSHFNYSTPADAAAFTAMGASIAVLAAMNIVLALVLLRHRFTDPALATALRAGTLLSLAGILSGVLMVLPRPGQVGAAVDGEPVILGAHGVGAPDRGASLPFTGWNADAGDLRVPHFVGMHALQVLPLVALALLALAAAFPALRDAGRRARLVRIAGLAHGGLFVIALVQALRGQSVARPDMMSVAALTGLAGLVAGLALAELRGAVPKEHG